MEQANETQTAVATNETTVTEVQAVTEPVQTNNVFSAGATPNIEPQPVEVPLAEMQIQNVIPFATILNFMDFVPPKFPFPFIMTVAVPFLILFL